MQATAIRWPGRSVTASSFSTEPARSALKWCCVQIDAPNNRMLPSLVLTLPTERWAALINDFYVDIKKTGQISMENLNAVITIIILHLRLTKTSAN